MTKSESNEMSSLEDKEAHLREIYASILRMTQQYPLKPLEYQRVVRTIIMLQEQLTKIEISKTHGRPTISPQSGVFYGPPVNGRVSQTYLQTRTRTKTKTIKGNKNG